MIMESMRFSNPVYCRWMLLPEKTRRLFQSDMRIVVDYLAEGNSYCSDRKIVHKEALIKLLRVLSGDENVEDTIFMMQEMKMKEEDDVKVCELFEQYSLLVVNEPEFVIKDEKHFLTDSLCL